VIGGVITSSLLTLVVVPVVYCYLDDLAHWLRRPRASGAGALAAPASKIDNLP
jgi:HAE1 family hydrophobic/amphiphilic exporter-1